MEADNFFKIKYILQAFFLLSRISIHIYIFSDVYFHNVDNRGKFLLDHFFYIVFQGNCKEKFGTFF